MDQVEHTGHGGALRFFSPSTQLFRHYIPTEFIFLAIAEFWVFALCFVGGFHLRYLGTESSSMTTIGPIFPKALVFAIVMTLSMIAMRAYQRSSRRSLGVIALRAGASLVVGFAILTLTYYIAPMFFFGRGAVLLAVITSFISVVSIRAIFYHIVREKKLDLRVLVLGTGKLARMIEAATERGELIGINVLGYVNLQNTSNSVECRDVIQLNESLSSYAVRNNVDQLVIAVEERRKGLPIADILDCKMNGIDVVDLVTFFERQSGKISLEILSPSWMFLSDGFRQPAARRLSKRLFDLGVVLCILPLALPLMGLVALGIWLESGGRGPILYRQVRVGKTGRLFQILKFRSMRVDAEKDGVARWAQRNDSRVTRTGSFIRKSRLDELPQLFNILRGDMSFVGPRPERPEFTRELQASLPFYGERHRVKPGLTGWAQISYPYGATQEDALHKLEYDLYYVKNYDIFLDMLILLQTIEVVLLGKGAR